MALPVPLPCLWRVLVALVAVTQITWAAPQEVLPAAPNYAASYKDTHVSFKELDDLIVSRHGESKLGRETRLFLLKLRVVDALSDELGVRATAAEVDKMLAGIEKDVQKNGSARNIDEYLRRQGVSRVEFLESLRLAVLQEKLARRGLGIPPGDPVTGEQQEMWLNSRITERGLKEYPAPWTDNIVLHNGNVTLKRDEFVPFLRDRMEREQITDLLLELLRVKRMRARMPDLDPKVLQDAVHSEIENRRAEVGKDPKYKGLSYEQLLASQGILFATWDQDPNIVQAALARIWIQRNHDEPSLRAVYENERPYFDSEFGEALEAYVVYLRATDLPNELIKHTHEEREREAMELRASIHNKADFDRIVDFKSQDRGTRERKGYLGWVTRMGTRGPSPARDALFGALDSGDHKPSDPEDSISRIVGPVRTREAVLLLWIGKRRPKPSWTTMMVYVHKTLRQRFVDEAVVPAQVTTYFQKK